MKNYDRDPCPYRILDDLGGGFTIGLVGGSLFHGLKDFYNNTSGNRMWAAKEAIRSKALVTAGNFGSWAFMYSTIDCALVSVRQKEDPWNSITAAGLSGAILSARDGPRSAVKSGLIGAFMLGMIEGLSLFLTNTAARAMREQEQMPLADLDSAHASQHYKEQTRE
eukprot:TRINITY_DN3029_c0_g2_i1.p1 TRINITY_DN3029_c0_g2~~TRINITY_DN3029_c0_g2_i1.p1  ORF type:complete len:166 (+),score=38.69 TRINITY_DN3029_c0_g2_i1:75-572(+)